MQIKTSHSPPPTTRIFNKLRKNPNFQKASLKVLIFLLYTLLVTVITVSLIHLRVIDTEVFITSITNTSSVVKKKVQGILLGRADRLVINIKHEHFQHLAFKREEALALGRLMTEEDDYVPATINDNGRQINVKIRLKGDVLDHLSTNKWSFRIKVKGDAAYKGLKVFSIQHPKTRNFVSEWLYHTALKQEGILSLRYRFVNVVINGKNMGVFALEEHFSKELIEHNHRREGPILKFVEDLVWEQWSLYSQFHHLGIQSDKTFTSSLIAPFQYNKVRSDSMMYRHFLHAQQLLEEFREKKLSTSDVFDTSLLARYMAVSELLGAQHGERWGNIRLYYNPITQKLEPIGFDGSAGEPLTELLITLPAKKSILPHDELQLHLLEDPHFLELYTRELERVARPFYLDNLLARVEEDMSHHLHILYREYPWYTLNTEVFKRNRDLINYALYPAQGLRGHVSTWTSDSLFIEAGSTQILPVHFESVIWNDSIQTHLSTPLILPAKKEYQAISFVTTSIPVPSGFLLNDSTLAQVSVSYRIQGVDSLHTTTLVPYQRLADDSDQPDFVRSDPNPEQFPFINIDHESKSATISAGTWTIDKPLILPTGYALEASPGTTLDLVQSALIVSKGPLLLRGHPGAPIHITSSDSTGQGLAVLNATGKSIIEHAIFENLQNINQENWTLTSAINFYDGEVSFKHTQFINARSEDALNLVRTKFEMDEVLFEGSQSDAFDADFCEGSIRNTTFVNSYNDAIDVSGSQVSLEHIIVKTAGDKAISAGEFSTIQGTDVQILNSEIGIASKDLSRVKLQNSNISNTRVGLAIFQKKPEYGPGTAEMINMELNEVMTPVLLEEGSFLYMNGENHQATNQNVYELLYGNVFGRASK